MNINDGIIVYFWSRVIVDTTVFLNNIKQINVSYKALKPFYYSTLGLIVHSPYRTIYLDLFIETFNNVLAMIQNKLPDAHLDEAQLNSKNTCLTSFYRDFDLCMKTMRESAAMTNKTLVERYSMFHSTDPILWREEYPSGQFKFG